VAGRLDPTHSGSAGGSIIASAELPPKRDGCGRSAGLKVSMSPQTGPECFKPGDNAPRKKLLSTRSKVPSSSKPTHKELCNQEGKGQTRDIFGRTPKDSTNRNPDLLKTPQKTRPQRYPPVCRAQLTPFGAYVQVPRERMGGLKKKMSGGGCVKPGVPKL